jgi:hypothetical protein
VRCWMIDDCRIVTFHWHQATLFLFYYYVARRCPGTNAYLAINITENDQWGSDMNGFDIVSAVYIISERAESINNILLPKSDNMVRQAVTDVTNILCIFSTLIRFWNLKRVPDISHLRHSAGDCKSETAKQH